MCINCCQGFPHTLHASIAFLPHRTLEDIIASRHDNRLLDVFASSRIHAINFASTYGRDLGDTHDADTLGFGKSRPERFGPMPNVPTLRASLYICRRWRCTFLRGAGSALA